MKIQLCEDNALISPDGKPSLVVLVVTFEGGQQVRVPYEATKTIQDLYVDAAKMVPVKPAEGITGVSAAASFTPDNTQTEIDGILSALEKDSPPTPDMSQTIQTGDQVKCVDVLPRDDGNELNNGDICTVMAVKKHNGQVLGYEVINEQASFRMRQTVYPKEVVLHSKKPPSKKIDPGFEVTSKCKNCKEINALGLSADGKQYAGTCSCGELLIEERKT